MDYKIYAGGVDNIDYKKFNISLSRKQAREIGFYIFDDIEAFVDAHSAEYTDFLAREEKGKEKDYNDPKSTTE